MCVKWKSKDHIYQKVQRKMLNIHSFQEVFQKRTKSKSCDRSSFALCIHLSSSKALNLQQSHELLSKIRNTLKDYSMGNSNYSPVSMTAALGSRTMWNNFDFEQQQQKPYKSQRSEWLLSRCKDRILSKFQCELLWIQHSQNFSFIPKQTATKKRYFYN